MKSKKQKTMLTVFVMAILVVAAAIIFWQIIQNRHNQKELTKSKNDEIQVILDKDFKDGYPGTPREVLKMYSRITSCLYNQSMSAQEQKALVEKMREMFDTELQQNNTLEEQLEDLKADIREYKKAKRSISSYMIDKNSSVVKQKIKGKQCASLYASYLIQEGNSYKKSNEQFLLRQDEDGKWKILGWELVSGDNETTDEEK